MFGENLARPCDSCGKPIGGGYAVCPRCKIFLCLCCQIKLMYRTMVYPVKCPMCSGKLWEGFEEKELREHIVKEYIKKKVNTGQS